jgi:hypothetical protein
MTTFLQRVFAQSVQAYVEVLMDKASEVGAASSGRDAAGTGGDAGPGASSLAFLRTLHLARTMALSLVAELKMYDFRSSGTAAAAKSAFSLHETGRLLGGSTTLDALGSAAHASSGSALGGMLDQAVEELFVPYMEGVKYVDREGRSLTDLYAAYLLPFSNYHVRTCGPASQSLMFTSLCSAPRIKSRRPPSSTASGHRFKRLRLLVAAPGLAQQRRLFRPRRRALASASCLASSTAPAEAPLRHPLRCQPRWGKTRLRRSLVSRASRSRRATAS